MLPPMLERSMSLQNEKIVLIVFFIFIFHVIAVILGNIFPFFHFFIFHFKYLACNNRITPMFMRGKWGEMLTNKKEKRTESKRENENDRERETKG